jgi:uncharacterized protein with von Willebrand factor type A (vWA) domain
MSALLVPFLYELRKRQLKVGTEELVSLAKGMTLGLHGSTLEGFYRLSRSLLVHRDLVLDIHMHPLTLDGLGEAVSFLAKDGAAKLPPFTGNPRNAL